MSEAIKTLAKQAMAPGVKQAAPTSTKAVALMQAKRREELQAKKKLLDAEKKKEAERQKKLQETARQIKDGTYPQKRMCDMTGEDNKKLSNLAQLKAA